MSAQKKILFLLNPISGIGKKNIIPPLIEKHFNDDQFSVEVRKTERRNHGHEIAESEKENFDAIVAIGGDGSVNEIGSALVKSNCALGIIPAGSGNGLARHLEIPLNAEEAMLRIKEFRLSSMDTGSVNDKPFLGTCGFGFDAHVAKKFDEHHKRGFRSYVKLVVQEYRRYQPLNFHFKTEEREWKQPLVLCSIANACQYGNGFIISPKSEVNDGKFEIAQMKRFSMMRAPAVVRRFFNGTIDASKFYSIDEMTSNLMIQIKSNVELNFHLDGEPYIGGPKFEIKIHKSSLKVI